MSTKFGTIHPMILNDDIEKGKFRVIERKESIVRKSSFILSEEAEEIRSSLSSRPSLSADLVEAVIYDGNYRFTSERAHEVAMWCGLISFLVMGIGLVCVGLFMALTH